MPCKFGGASYIRCTLKTTFIMTGTNGEALKEILSSIDKGETQLPDFQRGWVWDDKRIQMLIASLTNAYPIGAAMFLDNTDSDLHFKYRTVEGVDPSKESVTPRYLILDGQQRFTSIYRSVYSKQPVEISEGKGKKIYRYYYLHIPTCLNTLTDRVDGVISVPESKIITENIGRDVRLDLSTTANEYANHCFPVNIIFDASASMQWQMGYLQYHGFDKDIAEQYTKFYTKIVDAVANYRVPLIILPSNTPKEAVCQVFENVNTGGVTLTVFELVTASFAADGFQLRQDWEQIWDELKTENVLKFKSNQPAFTNVDFLTATTLLVSYRKFVNKERAGVSCKKKDVLSLEFSDYTKYRDTIIEGIKEAVKFIKQQKIYTSVDLPYTSQLIPLAVLFAADKNLWFDATNKARLEQWYWCGVFGELYGGANETRYANDVVGMMKWAKGSDELPDTIVRSNFHYSRLQRLYTRNSAAYKGVMALILKNGATDFVSGGLMDFASYVDEATDIHHIFPVNWCTKPENNIPQELWNSVINKTPLYARSNRFIQGDAPSKYSERVERKLHIDSDTYNHFVASHAIDVEAFRQDNFYAFYRARANALCDLIEEAICKPVDGRPQEQTA